MLCFLTYYVETISLDLWKLVEILIDAAYDWAFDYVLEVMTPIINYITRDVTLFITYKTQSGVSLITKLLNLCQKCFENDE